MTAKQLGALRTLEGHGNTLASLRRHRLVYRDGDKLKRGIRGDLILAGWTLTDLNQMNRLDQMNRLARGTAVKKEVHRSVELGSESA